MSEEDIATVSARLKNGMTALVGKLTARDAAVKPLDEAIEDCQSQLAADIATIVAVKGTGPHKIAGRAFMFRNPKGLGWKAYPWTPPPPKAPKTPVDL